MTRCRLGRGLLLLGALTACARPDRMAVGPPPDALFVLGDSLYKALSYDSARAVWTVSLGRARAAGDSALEARLLTELGLANWRLGNPRAARLAQERAIELKTRLRLGDSSLSRSHNGLGLVAHAEGRHEEATGHFERAVETARSAGDAAGVAKASGNLGLPLQSLGDFERARRSYRTLREAGRELRDARLEGNGLANEAMVDIWEGDPAPAIARLDTARQLYRRIDYTTGEQNALGQLATAFELTGELDRAFASLDTSLRIASRHELLEEEAEIHRLVAGLHAQAGDWRRAIRYFEVSDSLFRRTGVEEGRGEGLRGAATAYLALGNSTRARTLAETALGLHAAAGELVEQLDDLLLLAGIDNRAGNAPSARRRLGSARTIAIELKTRGARVAVALAEARIADRDGNPRRTLEVILDAASMLAPGDVWAGWEASALAARAYARLGALDSAVAAGRRAVAEVERVRGRLGSETLAATFAAERADVYGDLVLALIRQGRIDEGFAVADAARSRGLLDHITAARRGENFPELARGTDLLRRIDRLVEQLRETAPGRPRERGAAVDPAEEAIGRELTSVRSEYEALLARAGERHPRAMALLGVEPVRLDDVRAALAPDEILLEYLLTSNRLIIFALRRDGLRVLHHTVDPGTLADRVSVLRGVWGRSVPDWRVGLPVSRALHQALIDPVRAAGLLHGSIRHLLIVPHGILGQLPFAALEDGAGEYLVRRYAVTSLPSAAALAAVRGRALGGAAEMSGASVFAPFPVDLPATEREAVAFAAGMPKARSLLGSAATEAAVRRALTEGRPVHVATHGTLNARNPMFSLIELARSGRGVSAGPEDDGRLEAHELFGLSIRSPLVFFSGCETGAGRAWSNDPVRGTADLTLAQGVLAAGAGNVISTLWRIDDAGAAIFASRFYPHLRKSSVSAALAAAQIEMVADPRYASPYYWAGYTLSGEGRFGGEADKARTAQAGNAASVSLSVGPRPQSRISGSKP